MMDFQEVGCGAWIRSNRLGIGRCDGRLWMQ